MILTFPSCKMPKRSACVGSTYCYVMHIPHMGLGCTTTNMYINMDSITCVGTDPYLEGCCLHTSHVSPETDLPRATGPPLQSHHEHRESQRNISYTTMIKWPTRRVRATFQQAFTQIKPTDKKPYKIPEIGETMPEFLVLGIYFCAVGILRHESGLE